MTWSMLCLYEPGILKCTNYSRSVYKLCHEKSGMKGFETCLTIMHFRRPIMPLKREGRYNERMLHLQKPARARWRALKNSDFLMRDIYRSFLLLLTTQIDLKQKTFNISISSCSIVPNLNLQ